MTPCLALVLELHHPLPAPGRGVGRDWADSAVGVFWPVLHAVNDFVEHSGGASITLAVSPSWTAQAADATAREMVRREMARRAGDGRLDRDLHRFFASTGGGDALSLLRRWSGSGAIEVIPTTATHTWIPSLASERILIQSQVGLAVEDHARRLETRPSGIWLPSLSYAAGIEGTLAANGLRYFGVPADAFLRGTVLPPLRTAAPMITPVGVAAFAVSTEPTAHAFDAGVGYGLDARYADPKLAPRAASDHAEHFLNRWIEQCYAVPDDAEFADERLTAVAFSAVDLARAWPAGGGALWLATLLNQLSRLDTACGASLDRYLARNPVGVMGRPGATAGGFLAARPAGSDLFDRCRAASDLLAFALDRRGSMSEREKQTAAEMLRCLLRAQQLDWSYPLHGAIDPDEGLRRASAHLSRFYELAAALMSGRPDRVVTPKGPEFLPDVDLNAAARA
ncbi:glycoside hydrolase family 57 protein [Paludisphaera rhizosphaerae]|uniref:hypothetical protein n=1 Tax=Paludisphaera rhizosphaerae TaxID=2711216 RepID=UPI0013EBFCD6|nr:hypothetical protein [Paludisphaera rhizosphaerae]